MLRGHIFDTFAQNVCCTADFQKNSVSQTISLPCNSKGLIFDFYVNRKSSISVETLLQ